MATIKAIEGRSVHQIQSGQVIVDLCSVVKELVENSLDAGASSIEVRFKNHGLDSIEVQDNGKGIAPEDFETVALKHHTSKLSDYDDLTSLETFGFRGEALSSLCALSDFHVITARAEDGPVGKRLEFEISGRLKNISVVAAPRGTTVNVEGLFQNLPVRRKELEKNIKREYGKVINLLHAYACVGVGVRFAISNQMPKAKKLPVFSTKSNSTTRENIANVYGAKTVSALVRLDLKLDMEPSTGPLNQSARSRATPTSDQSRRVLVKGHVSKPVSGEGRQAPDRQMFFVNSRPCGLPQVSKVFNEVYKTFNLSQSPFVFANLEIDTNAYDVNVSPDKRSIMLHNQTALLESLKDALTGLFENIDHTVPQSQPLSKKLPPYQPRTMPTTSSTTTSLPDDAEEDSDDEDSDTTRASGNQSDVSTRDPHAPHTNLIESWTTRDTEGRRKPVAAGAIDMELSKNKQKLVEQMRNRPIVNDFINGPQDDGPAPGRRKDDGDEPADGFSLAIDMTGSEEAQHDAAVERDHDPQPESSDAAHDDSLLQRSITYLSHGQGANAAMRHDSDSDVSDNGAEHTELSQAKTEPSISAITPGTPKVDRGPVANAFNKMRPKRLPLETAEITVGDRTFRTVIGTAPPSKRRRIHVPMNQAPNKQFGNGASLSRGLGGFAAPGSQMEVDIGSDVESGGGESDSDGGEESDADGGVNDEHQASEVNEHSESEDDAKGHASKQGRYISNETDANATDANASVNVDGVAPTRLEDAEPDDDFVDEAEKKTLEDERVAQLIRKAEETAGRPSANSLTRAEQILKSSSNRKDATLHLIRNVQTSTGEIGKQNSALASPVDDATRSNENNAIIDDDLDDGNAETKLSLTVSKADFERMRIVGQFNLGFILAVRPALNKSDQDELFIVDQHAADEKYNYERLQSTVTLQSQRLVRPKQLELSAIEEEIILNHSDALKANGFELEVRSPDEQPSTGRVCQLITLPMSQDRTFDLSDLEELLHLLSEVPAGGSEFPRPRKVQRMLAMRACRSSIMVGKTLAQKQMRRVVRHMGEMDKPWNCPHGRPTMRHLAGLGAWTGWQDGDWIDEDDEIRAEGHGGGRRTDWEGWLERRRRK